MNTRSAGTHPIPGELLVLMIKTKIKADRPVSFSIGKPIF